jgi:hypothetical protein
MPVSKLAGDQRNELIARAGPYLTAMEVVRITGFNYRTVRKLMDDGTFPAVTLGDHRYILTEAFRKMAGIS